MLAHLMLAAVLVGGALGVSEPPRHYVVAWTAGDGSAGTTALLAQADLRLREELQRRGAVVEERCDEGTIVLRPSLQVLPGGLRLSLVGWRKGDQAILGAVSSRVTGASRSAQLDALVRQICDEADQL